MKIYKAAPLLHLQVSFEIGLKIELLSETKPNTWCTIILQMEMSHREDPSHMCKHMLALRMIIDN